MSVSGWTVETLKEHIDARLEAIETLAGVEKMATQTAIGKAEAAQNAYNLSHNDLIRKAERLAELTMPRQEVEDRFAALREHGDDQYKAAMEKVDEVRRSQSRTQGRGSGMSALYGWVVGGCVTIVSLGGLGVAILSLIATIYMIFHGVHG
jgi:hypothetical protein